MSIEPFSLPSSALLENQSAWLAVFETINLFDAGLLDLRVAFDGAPSLAVDFSLPGEFATKVPEASRAESYRITLRCTGVTAVRAEGIALANVVADYAFTTAEAPESRRFSVTCSPGCALRVDCDRIAVDRVTPVASAD
jgi:hypothetical protein